MHAAIVDARDGTPVLPRGNWGEESTVSTLLLSLQALLSNPELDGGCIRNPAAAKLLMEAPLTYKQMALDCVAASLRVDGKAAVELTLVWYAGPSQFFSGRGARARLPLH